jgi:hypothetical protein
LSADDEKGAADHWEVVAEVSEVYEAELIALRLRGDGLEARVIDQSFRQEPLPSVRAFAIVRVYVPAENAEEARRLLAEGLEPLEDGDAGDAA